MSELKIQTKHSNLPKDKTEAAFRGDYSWTSQSWGILFFPIWIAQQLQTALVLHCVQFSRAFFFCYYFHEMLGLFSPHQVMYFGNFTFHLGLRPYQCPTTPCFLEFRGKMLSHQLHSWSQAFVWSIFFLKTYSGRTQKTGFEPWLPQWSRAVVLW